MFTTLLAHRNRAVQMLYKSVAIYLFYADLTASRPLTISRRYSLFRHLGLRELVELKV